MDRNVFVDQGISDIVAARTAGDGGVDSFSRIWDHSINTGKRDPHTLQINDCVSEGIPTVAGTVRDLQNLIRYFSYISLIGVFASSVPVWASPVLFF